jgi:hypothetical protein
MKENILPNGIFEIDNSYFYKICEKCKDELDIHETLFGIDTSGLFDFNQEIPFKSNEELKREERKTKLDEIFNNEL